MKVNINNFLVALTMTLLPSLASIANACTCAQISPCEAYADASVVFVGLVTKTATGPTKGRQLPSKAMSTTLSSRSPVALFKVEEAFLGANVTEIEISGGGTTCDYNFKLGERYLVYAYQKSGATTFRTNICSGTARISEAKDDLNYLRGVTKLPSGGTVFGEIRREVNHTGKSEPASEPITKAQVVLENGNQRFVVLSDANGKFELRGLPHGRYRVRTNPPTNYSSAKVRAQEPRKEWELNVPRQGCIQIWFVAKPDGKISGKVVDDWGIQSLRSW